MATKNNNTNTNSFASTNNNSKEETTMKANMNTFAQDCTHHYTFANLFYRAITLGEELSCFCASEDYINHRLALYVATGDTDPDPDDEVNFENTYKLTTSGVKTIEEHVPTITLHELEDRVYRIVKSFKNRRLEMHYRHSYDWVTTNIPTFRYTFLERIFFGTMTGYTEALKVFCNKDRTCINDYIDINFAPAELDDRSLLVHTADTNYDLLIMTNVTGMDEDELLEIAHEKAYAGIKLTFDDAYAITHPNTVADMTEICAATCDYHCIHWNECPFGKGEDDPTAGIYTTYAPDTDITFIMQDTTLNGETATTRVVGFYHGEPNDAATERFYGKLMADYGPVDEV
jgi:hypothetical protein